MLNKLIVNKNIINIKYCNQIIVIAVSEIVSRIN